MVKSNVTTITLTGAEQEVEFDKPYSYFWCANMGSSDVLMSVNSGISDGADGVVIVPAGGSACTMHGYTANKVYLSGSGKLQVMGTYEANNPFKTAAKGGGDFSSDDSSAAVGGTVDYPLLALNLYGKSVQDGTPIPESPVDIVSVGDDGAVSVTLSGKNLLDLPSAKTMDGAVPEFVTNGFRTNAKDDGSRIIVCNCNLTTGKTYYLSYEYEVENTTSSVVAYAKGSDGEQYGIGNKSFVAQYNFTEIRFYIPNTSVGDNVYFTVTNPQIEVGTAKTDFVPFQGCKTAEITSGLPLCSVGDVRDELIFNADGTGKIIKRTVKLDSYADEEITGNYISSTGGLDTGAAVVYVLDTPQEIELSAAEMTALTALQTYNGMTNVFNDEGAEMYVKACTNAMLAECIYPILKRYGTRIENLEAAVLALGGNV